MDPMLGNLRMRGLLLSSFLGLTLQACSPETQDFDSSHSPEDSGEPLYVVDGETPDLPSYDEDELRAAIEEALITLMSIDAEPILDAYDSLLAHAESGCPDWLNSNGTLYWFDHCSTADGTAFDGFGTQVLLEDFEDEDGTVWNQRSIYMVGELSDIDHNTLTATGNAGAYSGLGAQGQIISLDFLSKDIQLSGDIAADSWLAEMEHSPALYRYALSFPEIAGHALSMTAQIELTIESADLLVIDNLLLYNEALGSECPQEPAGNMSIRMQSGAWLDLSFDGPNWAPISDPEACDGCSKLWAQGQFLGEFCIDFTGLLPEE
jgi:hypothetical protein